MELQSKQQVRSVHWIRALWVLAAIYLPGWVGFGFGVGHCDVCRRAWLWVVWIVPAGIVQEIVRHLFELPGAADGITFASALLVQAVWIAGWCWLAQRGRWFFCGVLVVAFGVSVFGSWAAYWLIRA